MELIRIFVDEASAEGLYAVHYPDADENEFDRLFELWSDAEYVHGYCLNNMELLKSPYFEPLTVDDIETKIINEAGALENRLLDYAEDGLGAGGNTLEMLFKPLNNNEHQLPLRQETKAKNDQKQFPKPILRIYGLRLGPNTFVVTGGAIKLTHLMQEHEDTREELRKLKNVKAFLALNGIEVPDDINYFYEQPED